MEGMAARGEGLTDTADVRGPVRAGPALPRIGCDHKVPSGGFRREQQRSSFSGRCLVSGAVHGGCSHTT
jgi:hypothetical protein